jgi:hypothetical protein
MTLEPEELLRLLAAVARSEKTETKDLTRAVNGMIVQARLVASNPALRARARQEMDGLAHAADRLEQALRARDA